MQKSDLEFIKKNIQNLKNCTCTNMGRSCNLIWIEFKNDNKCYVLDIQSAFRFVRDKNILCSNLEIYSPKRQDLKNISFDYENFNWDVKGENYFDEWVATDGSVLINTVVNEVCVSCYGDLKIKFNNDIVLEIFNNSLSECWRFFERNSQKHLVVNGNNWE